MGKVSVRGQWVMVTAGVLLSPVFALFFAWFIGWPARSPDVAAPGVGLGRRA